MRALAVIIDGVRRAAKRMGRAVRTDCSPCCRRYRKAVACPCPSRPAPWPHIWVPVGATCIGPSRTVRDPDDGPGDADPGGGTVDAGA